MLKKIAILLAACVLAMSLAACGSSGSSSGSSSSSSGGSDDGTYKMTYIVSIDDEFLNLLYHTVATTADEMGIDLDLRYAGTDANKVIDCIRQADAEGKDAVIVNLVSSADADACIEAAGDMKIVFINRVPYDLTVMGDNAAAVVSDDNTSGGYMGDFLVSSCNAKGQKDARYVMLQGTPDLVHTILRSEIPMQKLQDAGIKTTEVATIMADYDRSTAASAMTDLLKQTKDFDLLISNNDAMALGAIQSIKDAGLDPADYTIVGVDGLSDALAAIEKGEMSMTVYQSAKGQAVGSLRAAVNMLEGNDLLEGMDYTLSEESDRLIYIPYEPITADNVADYK